MQPVYSVARHCCGLAARIKTLSLPTSMVMLLLIPGISSSQAVPDGKKIVVFYDSDTMTPWKRSFALGLVSYLQNEQDEFPDIRIGYEYLGLSNISRGELPESIIAALEFKQSVDPASLIIATLSPNADSMYAFGDGLLANVPTIYVLASIAQVSDFSNSGENTWYLDGAGVRTLEEALLTIAGMIPKRKKLYVIAGRSDVDRKTVAQLGTILNRSSLEFSVEYLVGLPENKLLQTVSTLPPDSFVYFLTYQADGTGKILNQQKIIRDVVRVTNAPVFSLFSDSYVEGVVGGSYTDPLEGGRIAGKMLVAILKGRTIDPLTKIPMFCRFDNRQLKKWGIAKHRLPANCIIDHESRSIFAAYAKETFAGVSVVILLLFFAVYLKFKQKRIDRQRILFESVINSIPDGIFLTDNNDRIFDTNIAAVNLFGYSAIELNGMHVGELVDGNGAVDDDNRDAQRKRNAVESDVRIFKKKNGELFPGETVDTQIKSINGEDLGWFCLVRDISKRLLMEEERRQEQKVAALGELARGISHDFTNILGIVAGYAELAKVTDNAAFARDNLQKIVAAVEHGRSLVRQIMAFSRNQSIERMPISLATVVGDTMKLIRLSMPDNVELEFDAGQGSHSVSGSATQLQQVILNLTSNACKAIEAPGGRISISLEQLTVDDEIVLSHGVMPQGKYAVLVISDTGAGMSAEVASRAFEPFFTTRGSDEGHGMGLAVVYGIIKAHGGYLNLNTAPGDGTRIAVYFEILDKLSDGAHGDNEQQPP